ncbi:MAG: hypothetical protein ACOXZO_12645 [Bacteroidales bacterium]
MALTFIISTHLLNYQFIENRNKEFRGKELQNLRVVNDLFSR